MLYSEQPLGHLFVALARALSLPGNSTDGNVQFLKTTGVCLSDAKNITMFALTRTIARAKQCTFLEQLAYYIDKMTLMHGNSINLL